MALWLPKWLRSDEEAPPEEPSRRTFIFMGAAAGVVLATQPIEIFTLDQMPKGPISYGFSLEEANRLIQELYTPVAVKNLNDHRTILKYHDIAEPECSYCGGGIDTRDKHCRKCGAWLRRIDFSMPEELADDIQFFRKLAEDHS